MVGRIDRMAEGEGVGSYDKNATALDPRRARAGGAAPSLTPVGVRGWMDARLN